MKWGFHNVQAGLDMLSLILPTCPCHLIQMPSQNPQANKKHVPFAVLPFPCAKVRLTCLFFPFTEERGNSCTKFTVKETN